MFQVYNERIVKPRVSREFIVRCLAQYLGEEPVTLQVDTKPNGQPFLKNHSPVSFSLSHSEDYFVFACSKTVDVGIDIQIHRGFNEKIFDRICNENELARLASRDEQTFFRVWTIKEAALKCLGTGFQFPPTSLEINFDRSEIQILKPTQQPLLFSKNPKLLHFKQLDLYQNSTCHVVWCASDHELSPRHRANTSEI